MITQVERERWREMVEDHQAQCTGMQACCAIAASGGAEAITRLLDEIEAPRG